MSEPSENSIKIQLPHTGLELIFENATQILEWQDELRAQWVWLDSTAAQHTWRSDAQAHLDRIKAAADQWRNRQSQREQAQNIILAAAQHIFRPSNPLFGNKAHSAFIKELQQRHGNEVAAGAFVVVAQSSFRVDTNLPEGFFRGIIHGFLFQNEIEWTATAHGKVLENLEAKVKDLLAKQEARLQLLETENQRLNEAFGTTLHTKASELDALKEAAGKTFQGLYAAKETALNQLLSDKDSDFTALADKHEQNLKVIEDTFHNKLALQKPIHYWQKKKQDHLTLAKRFAWATGTVLMLFALGFGWLIDWAFGDLPPNEDPQTWQVGVTLGASFFIIWIIRLLVRMFLSHQHLAVDAAERVTMVQTFLSLSLEEKGIATDDRAIILQQLFRSASDGLVKDDGAPPSWFELLTRQK